MNLKELANSINELAIQHELDNKEFVEEGLAIQAAYIVSNIFIVDLESVFLFCSANNLLNTYVKQEGAILNYGFKQKTDRLITGISRKSINDLKISFIEKDTNTHDISLLIFSMFGCQFSFHNIEQAICDKIPNTYKDNFEWDGKRKQKCATSIFELVLNSLKESENTKVIIGESIRLKEEYLSKSKEKKYFERKCKLRIK